jgi:hypothetical protein
VAIVGIVCPWDNSYQDFDTCIHAHDNFCERNCHAPVELLHVLKGNNHSRRGAGWSATTLTSCPRAVALLEVYDYYEPLVSGWNKTRGEWWHQVLDSVEAPEGVIKEQRIYRYIDINGKPVRLTGKPDKVYTLQGVLLDGKSKEKLPKVLDPNHEAQFNVYVYLVADGKLVEGDVPIQVKITKGGMHYVTWRTKPDQIFLKMRYPIWPLEQTEDFIRRRLTPLVQWRETGDLPKCDPYVRGRWKCDCEKISDQLTEREITIEEHHETQKR